MAEKQTVEDSDYRSDFYYIASTKVRCDCCGQLTTVVALAMGSHELMDGNPDEPADCGWVSASAPAILFDVITIPEPVRGQLQKVAGSFRVSLLGADGKRWMNHCSHCSAAFSDEFLHSEPGSAFFPVDSSQAAQILLRRIDEPLSVAAAGYTMDPEYFGALARL